MDKPPAADFQELMNVVRGFRPAKILMVATDLEMFNHLEEPRTAAEIAGLVQANPRATGIILDALAALGLITKNGERFQNGELTSRYLVQGKENYRGAIVHHMHHAWWSWSELEGTVRRATPTKTRPSAGWTGCRSPKKSGCRILFGGCTPWPGTRPPRWQP